MDDLADATRIQVCVATIAALGTLLAILSTELRRAGEEGAEPSPAAAFRRNAATLALLALPLGMASALRWAIRPPMLAWEIALAGAVFVVGVFVAIASVHLPVHGGFRPRTVVLATTLSIGAASALVLIPGGGRAAVTTYDLYVSGTCPNGGACGLNEHTGPGLLTPIPKHDVSFADGDVVHVVCQRRGGWVRAGHGARSNVWDKLDDGLWVSDLFVTPASGQPAPSVPLCGGGGGSEQSETP